MLSNKWTFSLTYLVMLVAVGFAMGLMVTPDATAHELGSRSRGWRKDNG